MYMHIVKTIHTQNTERQKLEFLVYIILHQEIVTVNTLLYDLPDFVLCVYFFKIIYYRT